MEYFTNTRFTLGVLSYMRETHHFVWSVFMSSVGVSDQLFDRYITFVYPAPVDYEDQISAIVLMLFALFIDHLGTLSNPVEKFSRLFNHALTLFNGSLTVAANALHCLIRSLPMMQSLFNCNDFQEKVLSLINAIVGCDSLRVIGVTSLLCQNIPKFPMIPLIEKLIESDGYMSDRLHLVSELIICDKVKSPYKGLIFLLKTALTDPIFSKVATVYLFEPLETFAKDTKVRGWINRCLLDACVYIGASGLLRRSIDQFYLVSDFIQEVICSEIPRISSNLIGPFSALVVSGRFPEKYCHVNIQQGADMQILFEIDCAVRKPEQLETLLLFTEPNEKPPPPAAKIRTPVTNSRKAIRPQRSSIVFTKQRKKGRK